MQRLNSPEYQRLRELLVEAREQASLTQTDLAQRLGRTQTFVSKYELGDRRLDVVDFMHVCDGIGVNPVDVLRLVWVAARRKGGSLHKKVSRALPS